MVRRLTRVILGILLSGHLISAGQAVVLVAGAKIEPASMIFVSGRTSNAIVGIDTRVDEIVVTYTTPGVPMLSLVAGKQRRLVAITREPRRLSVFVLESGQPVSSKDPGFDVEVMQLAPDGRRLGIAGPGGLALLDIETGKLHWTAPLVGSPGAMAFDRDGAALLFGDTKHETIHVVNSRTGTRLPDISLRLSHVGVSSRHGVTHLARTPGGSTAMAVHGAGRATLIDLKSKKVIKRLKLPGSQKRIFPTANSQYFIVPNHQNRTVSLISTWTHAESGRLQLDSDIRYVNTALADTVMFAFAKGLPHATVIDLNSRKRLKKISLPARPETAVLSPSGLKLYVALETDHTVAVIDVQSLRIRKRIRNVPSRPWAVFSASGLSYCH